MDRYNQIHKGTSALSCPSAFGKSYLSVNTCLNVLNEIDKYQLFLYDFNTLKINNWLLAIERLGVRF